MANWPRLTPVPPPPAEGSAPAATDAAEDDRLMLAARGGERGAFDALVRRHQRRVLGFAMKFFNHQALAYDIAQDVFVDVYRAVGRYRPEGHFKTYLYRVTLNRCRMAARSRRYEDNARAILERAPEEVARSPQHERDRAVQGALMRLTEKQREVLVLRFWSDLKHEEIAETLGTAVGTVKSRLFGALEALRREMQRP